MSPKSFQHSPSLDPLIKGSIEELYRVCDIRDEVEAWANCFAEDAVLKKGTVEIRGRAAILELGTKGWETIRERDHKVFKVFSSGPDQDEVMLYGRTERVMMDGSMGGGTWAARQRYVRVGGEVKIDYYHIYFVDKTD